MPVRKHWAYFAAFTLCLLACSARGGQAGAHPSTPALNQRGGDHEPAASVSRPGSPYVITRRDEKSLIIERWSQAGWPCSPGQWGLAVDRGSPLATLGLNRVIVSGPSAAAPDGFIRRIVAVKRMGSRAVVCTVQASLGDALPEGGLPQGKQVTLYLGFEQIRSVSGLLPGLVVLPPPNDPPGDPAPHAKGHDSSPSFSACFRASRAFQVRLNRARVQGSSEVNGALKLCPAISLNKLSYHFGYLRSLAVDLSLAERAQVGLTADAIGQWQGSQKLAAIRFEPTVLTIGEVPVVLRPVVTIFFKEEGSLESRVQTSVSQHARGHVLVQYGGGKWSGSFPNPTNGVYFPHPTIAVGSAAKVALGARIELEIDGVVGPYFEPAGFVRATYATGARPPCWLEGGLEGSAGVDLEILGHVIKSKNFGELFDLSRGGVCP